MKAKRPILEGTDPVAYLFGEFSRLRERVLTLERLAGIAPSQDDIETQPEIRMPEHRGPK